MNIDIAISLLIIINVLKLVAGMEKCNVCYCETGKFGMSDIRWLYIYPYRESLSFAFKFHNHKIPQSLNINNQAYKVVFLSVEQ